MAIDKPKRNRSRLFIEVSLCILIVAIISAILYPVVAQDKGSHRNACLSNLKQLTLASIQYSDDSDGNLPPDFTFDGAPVAQRFIDVTRGYLKNSGVYLCPQDEHQQNGQEGLAGKMSYVHSLALRGLIPEFSSGRRVLSEKMVENPAEVVYLRDPIRGLGLPEPRNSQIPQDNKPQFLSPHGSSFVHGYLDGHARMRTPIDEFKEL